MKTTTWFCTSSPLEITGINLNRQWNAVGKTTINQSTKQTVKRGGNNNNQPNRGRDWTGGCRGWSVARKTTINQTESETWWGKQQPTKPRSLHEVSGWWVKVCGEVFWKMFTPSNGWSKVFCWLNKSRSKNYLGFSKKASIKFWRQIFKRPSYSIWAKE